MKHNEAITTPSNRHEFIRGFAEATGLPFIQADCQWAAASVQLSYGEILAIEARGYAEGLHEGKRFAEMFS